MTTDNNSQSMSAPRSFAKGDRVRHIGGTVEGLVKSESLISGAIWVTWDDSGHNCATRIDSLELAPVPTPAPSKSAGETIAELGVNAAKWASAMMEQIDGNDHAHVSGWFANAIAAGYDQRVRETAVRENATSTTPPAPKPPETLSQEAEIAIGMVPYREWSSNLTTGKIDASDSFKVKSMIDYAREIPATAPFASLIFDLANFLEDATKDNPCTGAFCTFDPRGSCEFCGKSNDEHAKVFHANNESVPTPPEPKPHPWGKDRDKIECGDRITLSDGWRYLATSDGDPCLIGTYMRVERIGPNGWEDVNVA